MKRAMYFFRIRSFNPRLTARARRTQPNPIDDVLLRGFNPRLTARARRTDFEKSLFRSLIRFQSTPHCESEANCLRLPCAHAGRKVSIHASLRERGEQNTNKNIMIIVGFQSTPHCESEANIQMASAPSSQCSFNPRLTARARRTRYISLAVAEFNSFNPRLTARARRTLYSPTACCFASRFNPRLTARARRTHRHRLDRAITSKFQSTPHCESEANALCRIPYSVTDAFQSTPHCESEANRFNRVRKEYNLLVSIHASLRERGEPQSCTEDHHKYMGFNPRLTARARRTLSRSSC